MPGPAATQQFAGGGHPPRITRARAREGKGVGLAVVSGLLPVAAAEQRFAGWVSHAPAARTNLIWITVPKRH